MNKIVVWMQLTLHAANRTPHGDSCLAQYLATWSATSRRIAPYLRTQLSNCYGSLHNSENLSTRRVVYAYHTQGVVSKTRQQRVCAARTALGKGVTEAHRARQATVHPEGRRVGPEEDVWRARGRAIRRNSGAQEGLGF